MSFRTLLYSLSIFLLYTTYLIADEDDDITQPHLSIPASNLVRSMEKAKPDKPIPMANIEGEPTAFVHQCVNIISGQFCHSATDLIAHHATDPIVIERSYFGSCYEAGVLGAGWTINHCSGIVVNTETLDNSSRGTLLQDHGGQLNFKRAYTKVPTPIKVGETTYDHWYQYHDYMEVSKSCLQKGITNNAAGYISGQTNLKNHRLEILDKKSSLLTSGSGSKTRYTLQEDEKIQRPRDEIRPNGNKIHYHYERKHHKNYLTSIDIVNNANKRVASLPIPITRKSEIKKNKQWKITTEDGRWVNYNFVRVDGSMFLDSVEKSDAPSEEYSYLTFHEGKSVVGGYLTKKINPDNRFINIEYYEEGHNDTLVGGINLEDPYDPRIYRIKRLLAPAGTDATPIPIYHFVYNLNTDDKNKASNGGCDVWDAVGNRTLYVFDEDHRLTGLQKFKDHNEHYTTEFLHWAKNDTPERTHLMARGLQNTAAEKIFIRAFKYDERGNVLKDTLTGNLSGHSQIKPELETLYTIQKNGSECYHKSYLYSNDGFNLVLKETDGTKTTFYQYAPGTNRLIAKFQGTPKKIMLRWFYTYNDDAALVQEIQDDGSTRDVNDLQNVTERHITYITPSKTYPVGYPLIIREKCLNLATGNEKLIHKVVNHYNNHAKIEKQDHYDNKNALTYTLTWEYDHMGNVTKETDPLGQLTERKYDLNGNCIYEKGPHPDFHKVFTYDLMNRLIKEEEVHSDGYNRSISHRFNPAGQRVATIDINGNETQYHYDPFGRVTQIIYPQVLDENKIPYNPVITKEYDYMGNVIKETDAKGLDTHKRYTLRGQLASVTYPDGTSEDKIYNLDGSLKETRAKNGTRCCYHNDPLGRPTSVETFSASGELLSKTTTTYSGFHILTETDAMGNLTTYEYYPTGQLQQKICGSSRTTYEYDSLGRQSQITQYAGPKEGIVKKQKYDLLNRVIEEVTQDLEGSIQTKVSYKYDSAGNICEQTTYPNGLPAITLTEYDSRCGPILITDPMGHKTITQLQEKYINALGQHVSFKTVIDPMGKVATTIQDALGRTVSILRSSSHGKQTQQQHLFYDANGNCCRIEDFAITTLMEYDSGNRLIAIYEAAGTPDQKQTKFTYNTYGQKQDIIKADGTTLSHTYDPLGRLATLKSSDNTVSYAYHYDANNNPVQIDDLIHSTTTKRTYDTQGRLSKEQQAHGLVMQYAYDDLGRPLQITLPDNTVLAYRYKGSFMREVSRCDAGQNTRYKHTYENFDLAGQLTHAILINQTPLDYQYDQLGRPIAITTNHWHEKMLKYDDAGNLLKISRPNGESNFKYDPLSQLTSESGPVEHTYRYDPYYNRISKDNCKNQFNAASQLLHDGNATYSYDGNGNLKQKTLQGKSTLYTYDALDRLIGISDANQKVTYTYDESNRRLSKTIKSSEKEFTERYLYQGQNEIGTCDAAGHITQLRVLGIGKGAEIGAAIAMEVDNKVYAPIHDHNGSVACLLDGVTGELVGSYRYSAFGEALDSAEIPWTFSSKRYDEESGFFYFGRRYYDPEAGRWVTPDPIGRTTGPNLYAYVLNNPLTHIDLYGLFGQPGGLLDRISNSFSRFGQAINNCIGNIGRFWRNECPIPIVRDAVSAIHHFCNHGTMRGYTWEFQRPKAGFGIKYGAELTPDQGVAYAPGINNNKESIIQAANNISKMYGDSELYFLGNIGRGTCMGVLETIGQKLHINGAAVQTLVDKVRDYFSSHSANATLQLLGFSQGGQIIDCLKNHLSRDMLKRIHVATFGSAKQVSNRDFGSAINYVSCRDPVPFIADAPGIIASFFSNSINTVFLDSNETPFLDHRIDSPTYQKALDWESQKYLSKFRA